MGREAWRATVHRVAKSRTRLKRLSKHGRHMYVWVVCTRRHVDTHVPLFRSSVASDEVFYLWVASVVPLVERGCLGLEAEAWMTWPFEVSPGQRQYAAAARALKSACWPAVLCRGLRRCLLKSTRTQGRSSLPSELRISPRQEGRVRGQETGRKAWRHELGCQGLDCIHSLLDVSVALILNRFSSLCLCLFCKEFLVQYFISGTFFFQLLQERISMQLEREATHAHTHVCLHTYTCVSAAPSQQLFPPCHLALLL